MAQEGTSGDFERFVAPVLVETLGQLEDAQSVAASLALLLRDFVTYTALSSVDSTEGEVLGQVRPATLDLWRGFLESREH